MKRLAVETVVPSMTAEVHGAASVTTKADEAVDAEFVEMANAWFGRSRLFSLQVHTAFIITISKSLFL